MSRTRSAGLRPAAPAHVHGCMHAAGPHPPARREKARAVPLGSWRFNHNPAAYKLLHGGTVPPLDMS